MAVYKNTKINTEIENTVEDATKIAETNIVG